MPRSPRIVAALAVTILLSVVACGGGSKRLTKAEFISAWDAICKADNQKTDTIGTDLPDTATSENLPQFADALQQLVDVGRSEISKLSAVKPPQEDQARIDTILSQLNQVLGHLEEAQEAASNRDVDSYNAALDKANPPIDAANQSAADYGFKECGS